MSALASLGPNEAQEPGVCLQVVAWFSGPSFVGVELLTLIAKKLFERDLLAQTPPIS